MMETDEFDELELIDEAEAIAEDVLDAETTLPDGERGWVGYDVTDGTLVLEDQKGIYSGQLGIALFLAAMDSVSTRRAYLDHVYRAVDFLLEEDVDELVDETGAGAESGLGSVVYGLCVLSELTGDARFRERAGEFGRELTTERIEADEDYDVLQGTSGTLLGLLKFYEQSADSGILDRAVECGEYLLDSRYEKWGYDVWDTYWGDDVLSFSTGMGHGAAGIGYALYRLYAHTERDEFRDAADEALRFENLFYSEYRGRWKANWTIVPDYPNWWCYGLSGVALARLGSLEHHRSKRLVRDVDRARSGLEPELAPRDSLCHGTFSQVELLIELGRRFGGEYLGRARGLAARAIRRKRDLGAYRVELGSVDGVYNPAFFLGTAGVGYTLLRSARPEEFPSILRFE